MREEDEPAKTDGHAPCDVCGCDGVCHENDGHIYCYTHHIMWCQGVKYEKMKSLRDEGQKK